MAPMFMDGCSSTARNWRRESYSSPVISQMKKPLTRCKKPARLVWKNRSAYSSLFQWWRKLWGNTVSDDIRIRLLIVDDEQSIRRLCMTIGEALGFICMEAESGESALALLEEQPAHIILTDMVMPNMSGLEFLERVKRMLPRTEVAVMTGHGSVETAVQAMKLGAYDYISKPFSPLVELRLFLRRMAEKVRLLEESQFLRERVDAETELHGIVGASAKIQDVLRMISRLKDTRTPVLIAGESGTGKELVARAIHFRGSFANRPFVAVDCGSLVPTLIERVLLGYE